MKLSVIETEWEAGWNFSKYICQTFPRRLLSRCSCSSLCPQEPCGDPSGPRVSYLGGREVCQPPVDVQRVPAGRQAAPLQRPQLRRRPGAARDHLVKIEPQGGGVLVGALVLRETRKYISQGGCRWRLESCGSCQEGRAGSPSGGDTVQSRLPWGGSSHSFAALPWQLQRCQGDVTRVQTAAPGRALFLAGLPGSTRNYVLHAYSNIIYLSLF